MRRSAPLFLALTLFLGTVPVFAGQPGSDPASSKGLFEAKCARCHPLDRALRKNKDRPGWQKTVERMKGYAAGTLADEEARTIIEYLSRVRGPANP
jgi:cytochrome c2